MNRQPFRQLELATNTLARISPMVRGRSSKMLWCARVCVRGLQGRMAWTWNQLEAVNGSVAPSGIRPPLGVPSPARLPESYYRESQACRGRGAVVAATWGCGVLF